MGISTAKSGEFEGIFRAHDQIASTAITSIVARNGRATDFSRASGSARCDE
jgi:hypothetical protein